VTQYQNQLRLSGICEPATSSHGHGVRGDAGHAADDGQFGDGLVEGTALAPLGNRVLLDGTEQKLAACR
jgi:hypothetical protein